jgi:hypothetical protein
MCTLHPSNIRVRYIYYIMFAMSFFSLRFSGDSTYPRFGGWFYQLLSVPSVTHLAPMLGGWAQQGTRLTFGGTSSSHARRSGDEDITTNDTSTPTPASTSAIPVGPITRARAHRLTHQVSSLLSSDSLYLDNGYTCTLVLVRNNGVDQKGSGITQAGFGL